MATGGESTMRIFGLTVAAAATFMAAVGLAGVAGAAPTGGGNAADTIRELRAEGYAVQINGSVTDPLSQCTTTGVHGVPDTAGSSVGPESFTTVYVDVSCPDDH
jgi:hypothetical protein